MAWAASRGTATNSVVPAAGPRQCFVCNEEITDIDTIVDLCGIYKCHIIPNCLDTLLTKIDTEYPDLRDQAMKTWGRNPDLGKVVELIIKTEEDKKKEEAKND
jgi:hypothetical protein